jgi:hypothetical protein
MFITTNRDSVLGLTPWLGQPGSLTEAPGRPSLSAIIIESWH